MISTTGFDVDVGVYKVRRCCNSWEYCDGRCMNCQTHIATATTSTTGTPQRGIMSGNTTTVCTEEEA